MSIFQKLNTLMRAGVRESAEKITDANALRIYRQEVVDAENLLARRRTSMAAVIATRKDLEQEIEVAQKRVRSREAQLSQLPEADRSESLLMLAAQDIASCEAHIASLQQRHVEMAQRINSEEISLRKLLAELKEHRRELKVLEAQLRGTGSIKSFDYSGTVSGHLATLRATRADLTGMVTVSDNAEASMEEALERVDGDPLQRELHALGRDDESLRVKSVLARLQAM